MLHWLTLKLNNLLDLILALRSIRAVLIDDYLQRYLHQDPKYANSKRVSQYEHQVFSQNGEDGILQEIFRRIGASNRFFVEFGVGNGLENNTAFLLIEGWSGRWMDCDRRSIAEARQNASQYVQADRLRIQQASVTAESINDLLRGLEVPSEIDLLSIDIDGNDYWVWKAITATRPRVVVIEYNPIFPPPSTWVMPYNPNHRFRLDSYHGASLQALAFLGQELGYNLVGCNFQGVNAFFVRQDLCRDYFSEPFSAEHHYEPPRYFLRRTLGHRRRLA